MNIDEYAALDATSLAAVIASREVTADEVAELATKAITSVNAELNAAADGPFERPLDYDTEGRFAGVPFAIKDLICHAAGVRTRMGTRLVGDGIVPDADTYLMERFRAAGLATLAVTTTPELGFNGNTEALIYGSTRNPWNTAHSVGGSSGGSAALVAAGALPMAHANDGGGSIRVPAACNGLVGLKPGRGRVSVGPDHNDALYGMGAEFAVTRTVRDAAALLDEVAVAFPGDPFVIAPPERPYLDEVGADPGRLRIAVHIESWAGTPVDPEVARAVDAVAATLEAAGHHVDRATPVFEWEQLLNANHVLWSSFLAQAVAGVEAATGATAGPDNLERTTWACVDYGRKVSAVELGAALSAVNVLTRQVGQFFTGYDLLLTPTLNTPAPLLGEMDGNADLTSLEWTTKLFDLFSFTPLFNQTGTPAISLPLGQSTQGLPIGVQLAGPACSESLLLCVAAQLEQAMPWADRRPGIYAGTTN
ncbi:amidase [Nocardia cyriacigeorgica]|uniref:amidase n=1 Tax=Nocardia cyriacigeorgica TaxID=135487 RepID=A0A4U8W5R1_9NOCA|nr:amidase family protein [Nocardia cyriacigeorgica]VFA97497.1 6-aminohexanoate-cyclic-dimer hydrolase [Nocardia cyriacigeorgica]